MDIEQKLVNINININIDLQINKLQNETDEDFEKRVHKIVYYVNCKDVDYTLTIKELENEWVY